jgi:hypothetical protein
MALKTEKTVEASAPTTASRVETTVLELALYKNYTWGNVTYEKGKPYRFRNSDAMVLLAEHDTGRPIWRIYQKPKPRQAPRNEIVDATSVTATLPVEEPMGLKTEKRIDVGTDDEIADILNRDGGDITV